MQVVSHINALSPQVHQDNSSLCQGLVNLIKSAIRCLSCCSDKKMNTPTLENRVSRERPPEVSATIPFIIFSDDLVNVQFEALKIRFPQIQQWLHDDGAVHLTVRTVNTLTNESLGAIDSRANEHACNDYCKDIQHTLRYNHNSSAEMIVAKLASRSPTDVAIFTWKRNHP